MQLSLVFICIGINIIIILLVYIKLSKKIQNAVEYDIILKEIRQDVDELVIEINQTTERNISLIEDRIKKINSLLSMADKRLTLLNRETGKRNVEIPRYNIISKAILPDIKQTRDDQKVSKKEQVLELFRNGFSSGIIASKVGSSIGEVELIISLASGKEER